MFRQSSRIDTSHFNLKKLQCFHSSNKDNFFRGVGGLLVNIQKFHGIRWHDEFTVNESYSSVLAQKRHNRISNYSSHLHSERYLFNDAVANNSVLNDLRRETEFSVVPFIKEDLRTVISEVPEFSYYFTPDHYEENPYKDIPLDVPILAKGDQIIETTKASDELSLCRPSIQFSKLENNLRIVSIDRGGLTSNIGLFVNAGCRNETIENSGVCEMIEKMAFNSTAHLSWLRTIKTVEALGANVMCSIARESIVYSAECLRNFMPVLVTILAGNVLFPRFLPWEIKRNVERFGSTEKKLQNMPDALITELLHTTAWHNNTLGNKLYASEKALEYFNADTMRNFMLDYFSPDNMVFVGVNVNHDEFCKWIMRSFVDYNAIPSRPRKHVPPVYTGGDCRYECAQPFAHLAVAFETRGGWNSDDLMAYTVLQSTMGGGGSFSTGGPGKGMYTKLFLDVLNCNEWIESCLAFNAQYSDSGLFGIFITADPSKGPEMVKIAAKSLLNMGNIRKEELDRAKNSLKSSIWMNLECNQIVMEDMARQLLMNGCVLSGRDFCTAIDSVTESDIKRVVKKMLETPPTVVAYGNISTIPHYNEITRELKRS